MIWRLSLQGEAKIQVKEAKLNTWSFVAQVPHIKVMVARFQFKHLLAPLLLLGYVHIASPSIIYGGLLVS